MALADDPTGAQQAHTRQLQLRPPAPVAPQPRVVDRVAYLQEQAQARRQAAEDAARSRALLLARHFPELAEGQTGIPLARSAEELPRPRLQGPTFEGATRTPAPPIGQAEYERLRSLDPGAPHGEPPFPGYERGAEIARDVGKAVGRPVGLEGAGGATGEFAYRAVVPKTPAEFASAFATGGLFGETAIAGRALRRAANRAGMRLEGYAATDAGQAMMRQL